MNKITQAEQKLIVQFQKWFEADGIEAKVLALREQIGIPPEGIPITEEDLKQIGSLSLIPKNLPITEHGKVTLCIRGCFAGTREFLEEGQSLLNNMYFKHLLRGYIFFNQFLFDEVRASLPIAPGLTSLCDLGDAKESMEEYLGIEGKHDYDSEMAEIYIDSQRRLTNVFPIAIHVHPEASQRDIIDFIKKNWSFIKTLQTRREDENTKVLHSRTKVNKSIKERNQLIYELHSKGRTTKEIRKELANKQQFLDDGHILKIISLGRKKHENK